MDNKNAILKDPTLKPDEDYAQLRELGLTYIQELGADLWTDYNIHDPGITILEALCYAITELGYRTSLPMKDLLASENGTIPSSQTFFTANKILTQSPLNIDDYRKMLIDIPGIQNAWLLAYPSPVNQPVTAPFAEVCIFADCRNEMLTYQKTDRPINISGLYKVLLDLDEDPQLGDLNNGDVDLNIYIPSANTPISLTVSFPAWNKVNDPLLFEINLDEPSEAINIPIARGAFTDPDDPGNLTVSYNGKNFTGSVILNTAASGVVLNSSGIQALFTTPDTSSGYNLLIQKLFRLYLEKIQRAQQIVLSAKRKLLRQRNLCEDFVCINTIPDEEIAFCFDIDLAAGADINTTQAEVYFAIDNYLNPPVNFYLLKEMLLRKNADGQNYTIDEIFEGPKLKHGFIDTMELEASNLVQIVYSSEIISLIMNISGVTGVRNFRMTVCDSNGPVQGLTGLTWCLQVQSGYKPVLSDEKSKITFYKDQIPYLANDKISDRLLQQLLSTEARSKLTGHADDIPVPTGNYFQLDSYTSLQYLFPLTYGIGNAGLPSTVTDARRAQARQLKAYLLFFDQLLADFLSQLKNAGNLFSTDNILQTYYAQFIDEFKDYDSIYTKDNTDYALKVNVLDNQNSTIASPDPTNGWEQLYESNETFTDRRNRFLDHLMSRFAESFNDYAFLMYTLDEVTQQETKIDPSDLISSKINFLKDYPRIAYNRAKAYNYCPLDNTFQLIPSRLWDTDNVSGLEEKLCLLGGFADPGGELKSFSRRFLQCIGSGNMQIIIQPVQTNTGTKYNYILKNDSTTITSVEYSSLAILNIALMTYLQNNHLVNDCSCEGMHLIEHILLRPRDSNFTLAPICIDKDCQTCGEDDPYSFRISIILPYWPSHFNNMNFRKYFEKLAREESPAHCMVKVCWINQVEMLQFELCYYTWIYAMADYYTNKTDINSAFFSQANNNLIKTLYSLHSEYPVATLHDCDESKDSNPVTLGNTILGTINN